MIASLLVVLAFADFFSFLGRSVALGGDAISGYESGGRYFVCAKGACREVSPSQWEASRWHAGSVWIIFPLGFAAGAFLMFRYGFPSSMYREPAEAIAETDASVRASGAPLRRVRCGGQIGSVSFSGQLIRVTRFPAGLEIKPWWCQPFALPLTEIEGVRPYSRLWARGIQIDHRSKQVRSPVILYGRAARSLAGDLPLGDGKAGNGNW